MDTTWIAGTLGAENGHLNGDEDIRIFNVGIFIPVSSFQMEHLVEMCCEDLDLVSDVLDTFCVQGRQRLEKMESLIDQEDLKDIVFEVVRFSSM
jgi:hypothetical protein